MSTSLRVGVIGPSRRNNGTGGFIARFLHRAGAQVVAVAASSPESASEAARGLMSELGSPIRAWPSAAALIAEAELDAVALCTPFRYHEEHFQPALERRLHVLCEKPILWTGRPGDAARATRWAQSFEEAALVLCQNTQWPFLLDELSMLLGAEHLHGLRSFEMGLAPPEGGKDMFPEAVPHPASLLAALGATGEIRSPRARWSNGLKVLEIEFSAVMRDGTELAARIELRAQREQPRPAWISLNGLRIDREVLMQEGYRLQLRAGSQVIGIRDPMVRSIERFIACCREPEAAREARHAIGRTMALLEHLWPATLAALEEANPST